MVVDSSVELAIGKPAYFLEPVQTVEGAHSPTQELGEGTGQTSYNVAILNGTGPVSLNTLIAHSVF